MVLATGLALAAAVPPAWGAPDPPARLRVVVDGVDRTAVARPSWSGPVLLVDVLGLAPHLGLGAEVVAGRIELVDRSGQRWSAKWGSRRLVGERGADRPLGPVRFTRQRAWWELARLAELAGAEVREAEEGEFRVTTAPGAPRGGEDPSSPRPGSSAPSAGTGPAGWLSLRLAKSPEELRANRPLPHPTAVSRPPAARLPADRDTLRLGVAVGYVESADLGAEVTADGGLYGRPTRLDAFVTHGKEGLRFESGVLHVRGPGDTWSLQAGDLASEVWGRTRGARAVRTGERWTGSMSWYADARSVGNRRELLALRTEVHPLAGVVLGGEATSDGSWIARGAWRGRPASLFAYHRDDAGGRERDGSGVSGFLRLPGDHSLRGTLTLDEGTGGADRWSVGLRTAELGPVRLSLDTARNRAALRRSRVDSAGVEVPGRRFRLRLRYAWRHNTAPELGIDHRQEEVLAGLTLSARRFRLDYNGSTVWLDSGESRRADFVSASWRPRPGTRLEAFGVLSGAFGEDRLRLRAEQDLGSRTALVLEYGNVAPYQPLTLRESWEAPEESRFRILVRHTRDVATPTRGGRVEGWVRDPWGRGLAGVGVRLGDYVAITGEGGAYVFTAVPPGDYAVALAEETVPANMLAPDETQLAVGPALARRVDLETLPLGTVSGRVEITDGAGKVGGAGGVVVLLGDEATVSRPDGGFAFGNVPPGVHHLRLAEDRLPRGVQPLLAEGMTVGLPAGRSLHGVVLPCRERQRPVVLRELP